MDGRVDVLGVLGVGAGLGVCVRSCCVCVCGWGRCAWLCRCPPNFVFLHRAEGSSAPPASEPCLPQPCRSDQPCRAATSIAAGLQWSMDVQRHQYDRPDGAAWSSPRLPQISMPALPHVPNGRAIAAASAYAWWTSWWSSSSHTPPFPRDRSSSPAAAKIPASSPRDERKLLMLLTFCGHLACLPGMRGGPSLRAQPISIRLY